MEPRKLIITITFDVVHTRKTLKALRDVIYKAVKLAGVLGVKSCIGRIE